MHSVADVDSRSTLSESSPEFLTFAILKLKFFPLRLPLRFPERGIRTFPAASTTLAHKLFYNKSLKVEIVKVGYIYPTLTIYLNLYQFFLIVFP
jgi:hypothetical protein